MFKLNKEDYGTIAPIVSGLRNRGVFAHSVFEGRQRGEIFADDPQSPTALFVTSCGGFYGLTGVASNRRFTEAVVEFLNEPEHHIGFYALVLFGDDWERALQPYNLDHADKIKRSYFRLNERRFLEDCEAGFGELPEELQAIGLNPELAQEYRENFYSYYQYVWKSNEHFIAQGIGQFITHNNRIVSVCSSPYVGGGYAEIDSITVENYRNKGLATRTGIRFIQECRTKGLTPNWSCHSDNIASMKLAEKLGFEREGEYTVYWYNGS